jgi:hypothetical protein
MEIHLRVMQSRLFTALTGAAMLVCSAWTRNEAFPGDRPSTFETQVGNGFSIVTEVDNPTPFIGEQFSGHPVPRWLWMWIRSNSRDSGRNR